MTYAIWIGLAAVLLAVAALLFPLLAPKKSAGITLFKKELQKRAIPHSHLPEDFFHECIDFADKASRFAGHGSAIKQRAEFVTTIETLADMVDLWRRDPQSPMFATHGDQQSTYSLLFERYDLRGAL